MERQPTCVSALQQGCLMGYRIAMKEPRQLQYCSCANAAFSLIELLVVVAILAIITTLYWHGAGQSRRDRGLASCQQNLERIYLAMQVYAHDYKDKFPVVTNAHTAEDAFAPLVPRYTSDTQIFICPASKDSPLPADKPFRDGKISYAYYMGRFATNADAPLMSDRQVNTFSKNQGATVFSSTGKPPGNNHGKEGGNFLTCDGAVVPSGGEAPFSLKVTAPIVLLNPKP